MLECEATFQKLKAYLGFPELLSTWVLGEPLYLYLGVSGNAVSSALIREEQKTQKPIYYISKTLLVVEKRYTSLEKLLYTFVVSTRKLQLYFQAHTVIVPTAHPLRAVLHRPKTSERMVKWVIELGEFNIQFFLRTAIKAQALADFLAVFTGPDHTSDPLKDSELWELYTDGAS